MCPHTNDLHGSIILDTACLYLLLVNLVYQPMLDINPTGIDPIQLPHKLFKLGRILVWILAQKLHQHLGFCGNPGPL